MPQTRSVASPLGLSTPVSSVPSSAADRDRHVISTHRDTHTINPVHLQFPPAYPSFRPRRSIGSPQRYCWFGCTCTCTRAPRVDLTAAALHAARDVNQTDRDTPGASALGNPPTRIGITCSSYSSCNLSSPITTIGSEIDVLDLS